MIGIPRGFETSPNGCCLNGILISSQMKSFNVISSLHLSPITLKISLNTHAKNLEKKEVFLPKIILGQGNFT